MEPALAEKVEEKERKHRKKESHDNLSRELAQNQITHQRALAAGPIQTRRVGCRSAPQPRPSQPPVMLCPRGCSGAPRRSSYP